MSIINPLNVELPTEDNNICIICQEDLNTAQTYKLPECGHTYHTHCIVTWFRHSPTCQNYYEGGLDGKCPLCGNQGINNKKSTKHRRWRNPRNPLHIAEKERYNIVIKESKKPNAPKDLINLVKKMEKVTNELKEAENKSKEYKKNIKDTPQIYNEVRPTIRKLRRDVWVKQSQYEGVKIAIAYFPIVPIIIPTPIDIN